MEVKAGYKHTDVGDIPETWDVVTLEKVALILDPQPDHRTPPSAFDGEPYIGISDFVNDKKVNWDASRKIISKAVDKQQSSFQINSGDIIFGKIGTIGQPKFVPVVPFRYALSANVLLIKPTIEPHFLMSWLQSSNCQNAINRELHSTSQAAFGIYKMRQVLIPLPTKAEQKAIAETLSDADAFIEAVEQLLAKKRQVKQGAMSELLTGKRRLAGFDGKWRLCELGELIVHCSSGATPYRGRLDYYKGTVKWITSGELNYNVITDTIEHISNEAVEKTNLKVHPVGTFLMAITGLEAAGTRGSCGIVGSPSTTNQSCMAIYPTPELKTEFLYHYYVLRGNELALKYCQGTKQQSYTAKLVKLLPIDIPPTVAEQTAIAEILSDMDAEISALEGKLVKAGQVKAGMMSVLLTGRVRLV